MVLIFLAAFVIVVPWIGAWYVNSKWDIKFPADKIVASRWPELPSRIELDKDMNPGLYALEAAEQKSLELLELGIRIMALDWQYAEAMKIGNLFRADYVYQERISIMAKIENILGEMS